MKYLSYLLILFGMLSCQQDPNDPPPPTTDSYSPNIEFTINGTMLGGPAFLPINEGKLSFDPVDNVTNFYFQATDSVTWSNKFETYNLKVPVSPTNIVLNNTYNLGATTFAQIYIKTSPTLIVASSYAHIDTDPTNFLNVIFSGKKYIAAFNRYVWTGEFNGKFNKQSGTGASNIVYKIKFRDIGFSK